MILPILITSILIVAAIYVTLVFTFLHDMRRDHKKFKQRQMETHRIYAIGQP